MRKFFVFLSVFVAAQLQAQIRLPEMVSDSMILQRDQAVPIWGWASPNEMITVGFQKKWYKTQADENGNWKINLPATPAGGPYTLMLKGKNEITIKEVLFGDVWFCSGQSNMEHQLFLHDVIYAEEIEKANYPTIRQFLIPKAADVINEKSNFSNTNVLTKWSAAIGDNVRPFSAVAFFFAKKLQEKYQVPIGIINASFGGTPIEAWISEDGLQSFDDVVKTIQQNKDTNYVNEINRMANAANVPSPIKDEGLLAAIKWFEKNYEPKGWRPINIPGYWEDQGIRNLNGVVWYRREIDVPKSMTDEAAQLFLGRIVDADEVYVNGEKVGQTTYLYPQRRYKIAKGLLKEGKNTIVIRVTNYNEKGGFVPDKPYSLHTTKDTIDLKGTWWYKVGEVFAPQPPKPSYFQTHLQPTALYNAMVHPLLPYAVKGVLWYQGESNVWFPEKYAALLRAFFQDWRKAFAKNDLSFIVAQLPGFLDYNYLPEESNWAKLREAQRSVSKDAQVAMTVNIDLGEWNDIHPDNKKEVGYRMAAAAMKLVYGENIVSNGPMITSAKKKGENIELRFEEIGSGLATNDGEAPNGFAVAGADKKFQWVKASIVGDKVVLNVSNIPNPQYVRYGWADNPMVNLINQEGFWASPFEVMIEK